MNCGPQWVDGPQLREGWRRLYRGHSRDLLIRTIVYRMQELVYGGLSKATRRKLDALTRELKAKGSIAVTPDTSLREWRERTHTVVVTEDGFEYAGQAFQSLTKSSGPIGPAPGSSA